jgi:hypothetical protein
MAAEKFPHASNGVEADIREYARVALDCRCGWKKAF